MKYVKGMSMCCKNHDEAIIDIMTPALISVECEFEYKGFCIYEGGNSCDFYKILDEENAKLLNKS